ncbi:prepilin-type N-terminal cleavage/methylation domain-containing protein [Clostridium sp. 19966]|uniref:prepilin-type N-terminal cleavage/methylation domain-containing protein n=1 Tax=Clostridium sp. 19966 TaxID=2768166 RepID=UPI0028DF1614|nr:prepilin-type N-terminal cleavage/methylation domain-containing protein [Clostridium sp. 19966]MDT8716599.1 prepilin-type N-terminal cleavage/methylation domain-containing protein [Clostridium sp. 19966]
MKKSQGFTLIELIIVLAILAIIASIAEANYSYIIGSAKNKCAVSKGNEIYEAAVIIYVNDENTIVKTDVIKGVKDITDEDITINNIEDKKMSIEYLYDNRTYSMNINFSKEEFNIMDKDGRCISN